MYRALFIDESEDDSNDFLTYIDSKNGDGLITFETLPPKRSIEELIDEVFSQNVDAIIVDFQLNEEKTIIDYNVPYTGVEFAEEVQRQREGFPCFVITSFEDDAIKVSNDVNVVYQKDILHGAEKVEGNSASFYDRIVQQIGHYKARIVDAESEFNLLISKRIDGQLDATNESRLKALDGFLERAACKHQALPDSLKDEALKADLHKLIVNTDKLLEALDGEHE